jgi:SAM-dependent methyltransferase
MIHRLGRVVPAPPDRPQVGGPDHPMRKVTRQVAFEPGGWTPERLARIVELFDGLAPEWDARDQGAHTQTPLRDALDRGGPFAGPCVELGAGTGRATGALVERFAPVLASDVAGEMLRRFQEPAAQPVRADSSALPVRAGSVGTLVLVNAFLFPAEAARVLAPAGALVWVNTLGDATPIHLPVADVVEAMTTVAGGSWQAITAEAGWGEWAVVRRER